MNTAATLPLCPCGEHSTTYHHAPAEFSISCEHCMSRLGGYARMEARGTNSAEAEAVWRDLVANEVAS